ncbi:MAG: molybdenum cofactor biosynthesis protein MoaE [Pseudomonadota bacterium]
MTVLIQENSFDMGRVLNEFADRLSGAGAVVSFSGIVRDIATEDLRAMEIEHFPGMTERALLAIRDDAVARFFLIDALILHRFGTLTAGEAIMMVATAALHRTDAFDGAVYLMDYLKSRAPFWKKEITERGGRWVEAQERDEAALRRWSQG